MTGPSYGAILCVEKPSATNELKRRFSTKVFLPSTDKVDIDGAAVFADSKRSTRGGAFGAKGGVEGKICVCETDGGTVKGALLYAKKEKALALVVTNEPKQSVGVPTIVISRDQLRSFKDDLPGASVSVSYTSGSYETHQMTFCLENFDLQEDTIQWDGSMRVPANTTDHRDLHHGWVSEAKFYRNTDGDIAEFVNKDEMGGRVCLVGDCNSDRQFEKILGLAAQYGAAAVFTTYEKPPFQGIILPVVMIEKKLFNRMKGISVMMRFKHKSSAQREPLEPESQAAPAVPKTKSYASQNKLFVSKKLTQDEKLTYVGISTALRGFPIDNGVRRRR